MSDRTSKDDARERLIRKMTGPLLMTDGKPYRDTRGRELDAILATTDALAALVDWPSLLAAGARGGWTLDYRLVKNEPDHYVTFDETGWFIEHSLDCRIAGTIGTCAHNGAIRAIGEPKFPDHLGRWRITGIDSEGLPSLERVLPTTEQKEAEDG